ncbi:MAG: sigma-70 family RNA polymerase sigma factor [Rhodococcus sp. (in: high G+C Gram-positive bacteria)]
MDFRRRRDRNDPSGHVDGAPARESAAFDVTAAFDAHASSMLGFAVNVLRDRALAEDCVQETFLRAWRARADYDESRGGLRTWLFAIERNVIIDVQRSIGRMPSVVTFRVDDDARVGRDSSADTVERLRVVEALALLSAEHRQVIVAVHLTGGTYAELAESTGVRAATLRTRAFYAMRQLRTHFESQENQ